MPPGTRKLSGVFGEMLEPLFRLPKRSRAGSAPDLPTRPRHAPSVPTKTDRLKEHLTPRDLDAARREAAGEVVKRKSTGVPWDHVDEVRNAQKGLSKRITQLKKTLGDTRATDAERAAAQAELSEASRLLDHSKQFLPYP